MTQRQLAVVGLRLLGVYAAILVLLSAGFMADLIAALSAPSAVPGGPTLSEKIVVVGGAAAIMCLGAVALLLMLRATAIAKWIFRAPPEEGQPLASIQLTDRQLAVVCFKLLGIYAIILAIGAGESLAIELAWSLPPAASDHLRLLGIMTKVASVARVAFIAVAGILLLFRSEVVARWLLGETVKPTLGPPPVLQQIQTIALSVAGIFILLRAIPDLGYRVMGVSHLFKYGVLNGLSSFEFWRLFSAVLRFGLGIYLLFGARGLARFLRKIHTVATCTGKPALDQPTGPETKEQ